MEQRKFISLLLFLALCTAWAPIYGDAQSLPEDDSGDLVSGFLTYLARSNPATAAKTVSRTLANKLPGLLSAFPADVVLSVTSRLNESERMRVLGSLNGPQIMNLTGKMTPEQKGQLLSYLPSYGVVSLSAVLSSEQLGDLLTSLPAESVVNLTQTLNKKQNYQIISRLSATGILELIKNLNDSQAMEVLGRLPPGGILNITSTLTSSELAALIGSLAPDGVLQLVLSLPPQGVTSLISRLPSTAIENLTMSFEPSEISQLLTSLPSEVIVKITSALNSAELSTLLTSIQPESLLNLTQVLSADNVEHLLGSVSPQALQNLIASLDPAQLAALLKTLPASAVGKLLSELPPKAVADIVMPLPPDVINDLVSLWPTDIVVNVTRALNVTQMVYLVEHLSPSSVVSIAHVLPPAQVGAVLNAVPVDALIKLTSVLSSVQLQSLLAVMPVSSQGALVSKLPAQALTGLLGKIPPTVVTKLVVSLPTADLLNTLGKLDKGVVANITMALSPDDLSHLLNTIPVAAIPDLMQVLPAQVLASFPTNLTVQLLGKFSNDAIIRVTNKLSVNQLLAILGNLPENVISGLLIKLPTDSVLRLLNTASDDELSKLLALIPKNYISTLIASLDPQVIVNLTLSLSPENLAYILLSVDPRQVSKLLDTVPKDVVIGLITQLPQQLLVNLTSILPVDKLAEILMSLNSTMTSNLLASFPKPALSELISRLRQQPQVLVNLTMSLPRDALVTILTSLPDTQIQGLVQTFPQEALNGLILKIPVDLVLNLTRVLPQSFLTGIPIGTALRILVQIPAEKLLKLFNSFFPAGPMSVLALVPKNVLSQVLGTVTPQQIKMLLGAIPPQKLQGMVEGLLPDLLKMVTAGGSVDLGRLLMPALDSIVKLVESMDAQQLNHLVSQLQGAMQSALPAIVQALGNVSSSAGGSALGQVLLGLDSSLFSAVPVSSLLQVAGQMLPEVPRMLAHSVGQLGAAMLAQSRGGEGEGLKECLMDLHIYLMNLANGSDWAVRMFDASGKPSRGLMKGNLHMHGSYDMCLGIDHWTKSALSVAPSSSAGGSTGQPRHIRGSYCGGEIELPPGVLPPGPGQGILPDVTVELYLCLPNSCQAEDLTRLVSAVSLPMNITVPRVVCQEGDVLAQDGAAIAAICVLCIFGFLIFLGTALDIARNCSNNNSSSSRSNNFDLPHLPTPQHHTNGGLDLQEKGVEGGRTVDVGGGEKQTSFIVNKSGGGGDGGAESLSKEEVAGREEEGEEYEGSVIIKVLLAFSLSRNTERILGVSVANGSVTCLHGIRVLSIFWIIVGNSVLYMAPHFENSLGAAEVLETLLGQVVIHSTLAVDTFFLVSGCLTVMSFLREVMEGGGVRVKTVLTYYIHRYIRLTPTYAVTIMALTCLLPYVSDGPTWTASSRQFYRPCETYWWTNLFYVNNFYPDLQRQCVPWGWYLATDLQFHWLVAPFVIIPLALGFQVVAFTLIGCLVAMQGILTYYFEADINGDYLRNREEFWWQVFQKPYTRVAPFVLGLGLGYLLTRVKGRLNIHKMATSEAPEDQSVTLLAGPGKGAVVTKMAVWAGWLVTIGLILATVLVKYDDNHVMMEQPFYWSAAARAWHEVLYRIVFSLAVCWVVFMCATGRGGFINSMLSWKVLVPLSHLAFCIYLLHPAVILADIWQTRVPPYFTVSYLLQRASGYILLSAIFAFFLSVTVETPISALERMILNKPRRRSLSLSTAL